jgi:hypothetical protein
MTRRGGTWTSRLALASLLAGVFAACEVPEYRFPDEEPHCRNGLLDSELGETGVDCAGVCQRCGDGEPCNAPEDCLGGQCLENVCLGESCGNEMLDPGEMAIDCGGDCAPCPADSPCVEAAGCESGVCTDSICQPSTCNDDVTNGAETGEDCGGGDCNPCRGGEECDEDSDCMSGICAPNLKCTSTCDPGFAECDLDYEVECETKINTDVNHCGDCLTACELAHATAACSAGECEIDECEEPFDNCDSDQSTGCETDLSSDALHCGECDDACPDVNGTPSCVDSACQIDCNDGFDNCDRAIANGCETKISFDSRNCGTCRNACERGEDDEEPWCKEGECGSTDCPEGLGDCDGDGDCDYDLTSDPDSCNYCGSPCVVANGSPKCNERVCEIDSCDEGYKNCDSESEDGGYADGCETNTDTDVNNCGGCGIVCEIENGTAKCEDGQCKVDTCKEPFDDCDGDGLDCETNYHESPEHCGACNTDCHALPNAATGKCELGVCLVDRCEDGYGDCTTASGCETVLADSKANCGRCDRECVDQGGTNTCRRGECDPVCALPNEDCDDDPANGCEANTQSDPKNCKTCGTECRSPDGTTSNTCFMGACEPRCDDGYESCDSDPDNGCETHTATDENNCGSCRTVCMTPPGSGTTSCDGGVCTPACAANYDDCDGNVVNGCEEHLLGNIEHCGACNSPCERLHALATTCTTAGVCAPTCEEHFASCGDPWSGCGTDLRTNSNCGACGVACSGTTPSCVGTDDDYRCQAPITLASGDVDGQSTTGQLTLQHPLKSGTNRMVLLAIAADSPGGNVAANKPEVVTYGGIPMLFAGEQSGGTGSGDQWWGADLYLYYLTDEADIESVVEDDEVTVVIDARAGTSPSAMVANLVQLNGVHQTAPIALSRGVTDRTSTTKIVTATLPVETSGSRLYSITAGLWSSAPSHTVTPTPNGVLQTLSSPVVPASGEPQLRASGLYAGDSSPSALLQGDYAVSWNLGSAAVATHLAVVIEPAFAE